MLKHAEAKKKVLTEIMKLMDKTSGQRLHGADSPLSGESTEPEETDDTPADQEPKRPSFTWAEGGAEDGEDAGDEEDAPSDEELDAMEAKLAKHRGRK